MIGHLRGTLLSADEANATIDVNGVGYEVALTPRHLSSLNEGDTVNLVIETLVAETFIRLVGFKTASERRTFRLLQSVQGVGSKAALAILTVLSPAELLEAIAMGDKTAISRAQGVGPKLAQRIATELKSRTGGILDTADIGLSPSSSPIDDGMPPEDTARKDAVAALIGLGYDEGQAMRTVRAIPSDPHENVQSLITAALKGLSTS